MKGSGHSFIQSQNLVNQKIRIAIAFLRDTVP